jgi:type I restriction enzyme M protein
MAREKKQKTLQPLTTALRLWSIVKSCRDIMRKDKGLNGDLDRLPMLTWIMFLFGLLMIESMSPISAR